MTQIALLDQQFMFPHYQGPPISSFGKAVVTYVNAQNILTPATGFIGRRPHEKPEAGFDFTLNPYIGCQYGCKYCYASTITQSDHDRDNWGNWIRVKENAIYKIRRGHTLHGKRVYMSTVTDPYQPIEKKLGIVRSILQILAERQDRILLVVQTRSPLVTRDLDLFKNIIDNGGRVQVNMTITTDDDQVRRKIEPTCPSIPARFDAIRTVARSRVDTAVTMSPLFYVSDHRAFAENISDAGIDHVIAQPLHSQRTSDTPAFKATTWLQAIAPMAEILDCSVNQVMKTHTQRYQDDIATLRHHLPDIVEGRDGFKPPF